MSQVELSQQEIDEDANASRREALWGKPANDIINGRDSASQYSPVRAVWEMVQNARDVNVGQSKIEFYRKQDAFVYRHNGLPFTNPTLDALILQTSSKVRDDIEQVGQYGTGFLTTHKLGRKFMLSGSLQLKAGVECYCHFSDFVIDRTPDTKKEMVDSLSKQFEAKDRLLKQEGLRHGEPAEWTTFTYLQPHMVEKQNAKDCFAQAPELVPYVMCLNKGIKSIRFVDEVEGTDVVYENIGTTQIEWTELYTVNQTEIRSSCTSGSAFIISLDSKETITTAKGRTLPKSTVIFPLVGPRVVEFSDKVSRLFLFLPLIGTEKWGVNFIIHSPVFTCATENRSSLRLVADGQSNTEKVKQNHEALEMATNMIFHYIARHVPSWEDVRFLAPLSFDTHCSDEALSSYFRDLKSRWLKSMEELPLVDVDYVSCIIRNAASHIFVPDVDLADEIDKNAGLLQAVYSILNKMYPFQIPCIQHLSYWSRMLNEWYEETQCPRIVSLDNIVEYVSAYGLSVVSQQDLLALCSFLSRTGKDRFFDKNILLTEGGALTNKVNGLKPAEFNPTLKECLKVLLPQKSAQFVLPEFAALTSIDNFTLKDIKETLPSVIDELSGRLRKAAETTKQTWEMYRSYTPYKDALLAAGERAALLDYCRMIIPDASSAFEATALSLIAEFEGHEFLSVDRIPIANNELEWRGALRLLINNALLEFTLLDEEQKKQKEDWIYKTVAAVYGYSDFRSILKGYRCYKSQSGEYCYCDDLMKDMDVPEGMKDIYDILSSTEGKQMNIRASLFDKKYGAIADTEAKKEVVVFGNEIMTLILASGKYLNEIDTYEHKNLIMDIIENFENPQEGSYWKLAFETINKDIPSLLTKLVLNAGNREPMIRIMKVKDPTRLKQAAEIITEDNFMDIWNLGKKVWLQEQNEKADFEKKKEIGEYVEHYLREELAQYLSGVNLAVEVDDEQGGQDLVVKVNGMPVYYIEIKSRWIPADSVMMSARQLDKSVQEKAHYSLFAVDMVGYNSEDVREHKYPNDMQEFAGRIRVVSNIGNLNDDILPSKRDSNEQVHIGGDYKAVVPQRVIERYCLSYDDFLSKVLKPCVSQYLAYNGLSSL